MSKDKVKAPKRTERQLRDEKIDKLTQDIIDYIQVTVEEQKLTANEIQLALAQSMNMVSDTIVEQYEDASDSMKGGVLAQKRIIEALMLMFIRSIDDQRDEDLGAE